MTQTNDFPALTDLLQMPDGSRITTASQWVIRRQQLRQQWLAIIRPLTVARPAADFTVLQEDRDAGVVRQLIRYENEPGVFLEGYLLKPLVPVSAAPGFVAFHSTSPHTTRLCAGLAPNDEEAFAVRLARRGAITLCPINMLWVPGPRPDGSYDYLANHNQIMSRYPATPPHTGMAKMLFDAQRALDILASVPGVDPTHLGCVGHSLGAKESLYLAALDDRIKAAVGHEGGIGMSMTNWGSPWFLGEQCESPDFRHDHHELLALIAPRPFLWIAGDDADNDSGLRYFQAAALVYQLLDPASQSPGTVQLNHRQGHVVPPAIRTQIEDWLLAHV